jgi:hypothetical protein
MSAPCRADSALASAPGATPAQETAVSVAQVHLWEVTEQRKPLVGPSLPASVTSHAAVALISRTIL